MGVLRVMFLILYVFASASPFILHSFSSRDQAKHFWPTYVAAIAISLRRHGDAVMVPEDIHDYQSLIVR